MNAPSHPSVASIILLGDSGVGKSGLARRLAEGQFAQTESTHGSRTFSLQDASHPDGGVQIVDCGAMSSESELKTALSALNPAVIAIVVAPTNEDRLDDTIARWLNLMYSVPNGRWARRYLIAGSSDIGLPSRDVSLQAIASHYEFDGLYAVSAKTGDGIHALKEAAVRASASWLLTQRRAENVALAAIIRRLANTLCRLIADDPSALHSIEWRDLERVIAASLESLGFDVTLTPSSKDGGKDIIARCRVAGELHKYYLEIKHWRKKHVGMKDLRNFVRVNVEDDTMGGVFISTSGYRRVVYQHLTELSRGSVRLGDHATVVSLAQHSVRARDGLWRADALPDILFGNTYG